MDKINLGDSVKDEISGVKGVVVAQYSYLYGCHRSVVQPEGMMDGKPIASSTFDTAQLKLMKRNVVQPTHRIHFGDDRVRLGDKVKDKITGFAGVATGRYEYLFSPPCIGVQPQDLKDGKPIEGLSFDESQLEIISAKPVVPPPERRTGGPRDEPRSARIDPR